jgi:hypothetical protein
MYGTPENHSWQSMIQRCTNPNHKAWPEYGGIGVKVCDRWRTFETFYADLGPRPAGTTLGRFGDIGNYEPGNCKWMTGEEQAANRRDISNHGADGRFQKKAA